MGRCGSSRGYRNRSGAKSLAWRSLPSARWLDRDLGLVEFLALVLAAVPEPALATRLLDEDPAHRPGRRTEEMARPVPGRIAAVDETKIRFMHEHGCLQRMTSPLRAHLRSRERAQLFVYEGQELVRAPGVIAIGRHRVG